MNVADENSHVLNLVQAMIGALTPNFRRVTVEREPSGEVVVYFVLERDDPEDREEIEDILSEFYALEGLGSASRAEVLVDARPLHELKLPGRPVYGRNEER